MISFNKTTEYAFRIMSFMAQDKDRLYKSDQIYEDLEIPFRYLRRLLTRLSKGGLLISIQGKYGGFKIAKDLDKITLNDIVQAIDDKKEHNECFFGFAKCAVNHKCSMHDKWKGVQGELNSVLTETTLESLINEGKPFRLPSDDDFA